MRRPFVAANWKMHGGVDFVSAFAAEWCAVGRSPTVDIAICPPLGYLDRLVAALGGGDMRFGVQNVAVEQKGAYTGEHAAEMARDLGASFAIVGHSERRQLHGESDAVVAAKFVAAKRAGLVPIVCVGETLAERRAGRAESTVLAQLDRVLDQTGADGFDHEVVIAYEPVWAIGTGETATPAQAQRMHGRIRARLREVVAPVAEAVRVVYGGSVNVENARDLFAQSDIDGGLVGGASLNAAAFARICDAARRQTESREAK